MRALSLLAALAAILLLPAPPADAQHRLAWTRDYHAALQQAREQHRLVLVHFWAENCAPCSQLERNVLNQPEVIRAIHSGYVPVRINARETPQLAEQMQVDRWPMDVIVTPDGAVVHRQVSAQDPNQYIAMLDRTAAHARVAMHPPQGRLPQQTVATASATSPETPGSHPARQASGERTFAPSIYEMQAERSAGQSRQPNPHFHMPHDHMPHDAPRSAAAPNAAAGSTQLPPHQQPRHQQPWHQPQQYPAQQQHHAAQQHQPQQRHHQPAQQQHQPHHPAQQQHHSAQQQTQPQHQSPYPPQQQQQAWYQQPEQRPSASTVAASVARAPASPGGEQPALGHPQRHQRRPESHIGAGPAPGASDAPRPPAPQGRPAIPAGNPPLAIDGFCPVTLVGRWVWEPGDVRWGAIFQGRTYLFASADHQQQFLAAPERFAPMFAGYDPVVASRHGQWVEGQRQFGLAYREHGQVFLFASEESLQEFHRSPGPYIDRVRQAVRSGQAPSHLR